MFPLLIYALTQTLLEGFMSLFTRFSACYLTSYIFRHITCLYNHGSLNMAATFMLIKAISHFVGNTAFGQFW